MYIELINCKVLSVFKAVREITIKNKNFLLIIYFNIKLINIIIYYVQVNYKITFTFYAY